jgi:hypothetical protein
MSFTGYLMKFPVIRVKDKQSGHTHIVGTDAHDSLYISDGRVIGYYNMQNGDGTCGGYSFNGIESEYDDCPQVEFVTLERLLAIVREQAELSAETEKAIRETFCHIENTHTKEADESVKRGFIHT